MKKFETKMASWVVALFAVFALFSCEGPVVEVDWNSVPDADFNTTNQVVFQYCGDEIQSSLGQDLSETVFEQSVAIQLKAEDIDKYLNSRIVKVYVGLNGTDKQQATTQYDDLKIWVRRGNIKSEKVWEQSFDGTITLNSWNEVIAKEFYRIDDVAEDLFIGYTIYANGLPVGTDGADETMGVVDKKGCWIYDCDSKRWIQHAANGHISIKAVFAGDMLPKVEFTGIKVPSYIKSKTSFPVALTVKNLIDTELASFDLVLKHEGKKLTSKTVELPWTLRKGESMSVFVEDLSIAKEGDYLITYSIEQINGEKSTSDGEVALNRKTIVADNLVERTVLLENTTGDMCSNCPAGHDYIEKAMKEAGEDKFIWMAHHAGYNAGKYTSNQSDTIARIFYNTQMTYAPGLMIDRTNLLSVGVTTSGEPGGPIFSVNEVASRGMLDEYFRLMQSDMSPIALDVQHSFDVTTRNLSVTVRGDILVELANRNTLALGIAILEDNLEGTQAGVAGKYMHSHVCRDAMTSILGTLVKGDSNTFEFTYSKALNSKFVPENVSLVVWVANRPASISECDNYKVYQAYKVKLVK